MHLRFRAQPHFLDIGFHDGLYVLCEVNGSRLTHVRALNRFDDLLVVCRRADAISADDATRQRLRQYDDIARKLL